MEKSSKNSEELFTTKLTCDQAFFFERERELNSNVISNVIFFKLYSAHCNTALLAESRFTRDAQINYQLPQLVWCVLGCLWCHQSVSFSEL